MTKIASSPSSNQPNALPLASQWRLRTRTIRFDERPAVMGIVNLTPDSFSDGGRFESSGSAIDYALRLEDAGADMIDIGGESTRPYSTPVSADEELRRVLPVLDEVCRRTSIPVSIDTTKSMVASAAIDLGVEIVNDITGLTGDPQMIPLVVQSGVAVCAMHIRGTPQTMQDDPSYENVVSEIVEYLRQRDEALLAAGVVRDQICLDPGIGFGKTHEHNLELLRSAEKFLELGRPILIGHSRKGFVGKLIGDQQRNRDAGTLGISLALAAKKIQVLRVHDVQSTVDAIAGFHSCFDK